MEYKKNKKRCNLCWKSGIMASMELVIGWRPLTVWRRKKERDGLIKAGGLFVLIFFNLMTGGRVWISFWTTETAGFRILTINVVYHKLDYEGFINVTYIVFNDFTFPNLLLLPLLPVNFYLLFLEAKGWEAQHKCKDKKKWCMVWLDL